MNREQATQLLAQLLHRIAPEVDLDEVDRSAPLQDEIDLDSMDFLNLMTALHEETGIDVPERDYALLSTVDRFVDYVVARGAVSPTGGR
jgi:acyl carrier protein